jgi:hypothetical protein
MGGPHIAEPPPSAADDAFQAWCCALGIEDASPQRIAAVTAVLVKHWCADAPRIAAAAAVCEQRHREGKEVGWREAADLLLGAVRMVQAAGADTDASARESLLGQLFPDPGPFEWNTRRRRSALWWVRRLAALRVRRIHQPASAPAGQQRLLLRLGPVLIGQVDYQVCVRCRLGYLRKISVDGERKGYGIGTRAILSLYRKHPGCHWHTTTQYETAGTFWVKIARRTGGTFTEQGSECEHMKADRRR